MPVGTSLDTVRSALFLPAFNARAVAKARNLACDMVILDLEDAVPDSAKSEARAAAVEAAGQDWGERILAVRINAPASPLGKADIAALDGLERIDALVLPKVETPIALGRPILAMIETPPGLYAAREIAAAPGTVGLIAGPNDLAASLKLPAGAGREQLALALQMILLAARAADIGALDGVFNRLDDPAGFEADARAGRLAGWDGKTLIHPAQIEPANRLFGPSPEEMEDAEALVAAATGGAERFRGRMIEAMHVKAARRTLARAGAPGGVRAIPRL